MKKYSYTISTPILWTSFDYGEVEANSIEEAREKAIEKLTYDFNKCNEVLKACDPTKNFYVEFDPSQVEIEELSKKFVYKSTRQ